MHGKIRALLAAAALCFVAIPTAAADEAPSLNNLTPEEQAAFAKYLEEDKSYQESADNTLETSEEQPPSWYGSWRTTSTTAVEDNRIGGLYFQTGLNKAYLACTASHIGGKWWLTAEHCVAGKLNQNGYIKQTDGDFAGIENIYVKDKSHDIALIKVGRGINADTFKLATVNPEDGLKYTSSGFSGDGDTQHNYSSESQLTAARSVASESITDPIKRTYYDFTLLKAKTHPTCKGDSGGPVWAGNTQYAVNSIVYIDKTAKKYYDKCLPSSLGANVAAHVDWIKQTMDTNSGTNIFEQFRAFTSGVVAVHGIEDVNIATAKSYNLSS